MRELDLVKISNQQHDHLKEKQQKTRNNSYTKIAINEI